MRINFSVLIYIQTQTFAKLHFDEQAARIANYQNLHSMEYRTSWCEILHSKSIWEHSGFVIREHSAKPVEIRLTIYLCPHDSFTKSISIVMANSELTLYSIVVAEHYYMLKINSNIYNFVIPYSKRCIPHKQIIDNMTN